MAISNWESGRFLPSREKLTKIRDGLKLDDGEFRPLLALYEQERRSRELDEAFSRELQPKIEQALEQLGELKIPVFNQGDLTNPTSLLSQSASWKTSWQGEQTNIPRQLEGRRIFAFKMPSKQGKMPGCLPGDMLFCDLDFPLVEGIVVGRLGKDIFCGKSRRTDHSWFVEKPCLGQSPELIPRKRFKWCYRAVLLMRNMRGDR